MNRFFIALAFNILLAGAAQAAPHGILWARGAHPSVLKARDGAERLLYYGGPVLSHAKVRVVFWGNAIYSDVKDNIGPFFANILDSRYMDWLSQYNTTLPAVDGRKGTDQTIGRGSLAGTFTIYPANSAKDLTDEAIRRELEEQISAGKLPSPDVDSLYMIYFPDGVSVVIDNQRSCQQFCAYHEGFNSARVGAPIFYGVMPVCHSAGCKAAISDFDSMSIISSHEAIEAVTDPFPTPGDKPAYPQAWNTSKGDEIGDLCDDGSSFVEGRGLRSAVQWEWDNSIGDCAKGPWTQSALVAARPPIGLAPIAVPDWDGRAQILKSSPR